MPLLRAIDEPGVAELIAARPLLRAEALHGLLLDGAPLAAIARAHGTPTWVTGAATLRARYARLRDAMRGIAIHAAVKANDQLAVLRLLAKEGAGADVVSGGECARALLAGIPPDRIIFSGVGKTAAELRAALAQGIGQINVESEEELHALSAIAHAAGVAALVALRINPDVDAGTLDGIATGRAGDKFGIPIADAERLYLQAARLPGINPHGLAVHIGSQIQGTAGFRLAYDRMAGLVRSLRGQGAQVNAMDCGGGLGIAYQGEPAILPEAWAGCIQTAFRGLELHLAVEPGRWLTGPASVLLATVVRVRRAGQVRPIVILDAAMSDLARPSLYGAWHGVVPVSAARLHAAPEYADIAGPVCESSDVFARARPIAPLHEGDLVAILDCGAYGSTMSSTYNARPFAAQVMAGPDLPGGFTLTRRRQTAESLWAEELACAS